MYSHEMGSTPVSLLPMDSKTASERSIEPYEQPGHLDESGDNEHRVRVQGWDGSIAYMS